MGEGVPGVDVAGVEVACKWPTCDKRVVLGLNERELPAPWLHVNGKPFCEQHAGVADVPAPFEVVATVDGAWMVLDAGRQWGNPPFDKMGLSGETWPTREEAVAAVFERTGACRRCGYNEKERGACLACGYDPREVPVTLFDDAADPLPGWRDA